MPSEPAALTPAALQEPSASPALVGTQVIKAAYRVRCAASEIERVARDIALEQTVEVPEELILSDEHREGFVGRVAEISELVPTSEAGKAAVSSFAVTIDYPAHLAQGGLSQMLNLLFGNISLKQKTLLEDITFPLDDYRRLGGPRLGIDGLRADAGVYGRPLVATALKPRGSTIEQLASLAYEFSAGGGDVVKDDHNLVDADFDVFRRRVEACQRSVERGGNALYFPNFSGPLDVLERQAKFCRDLGIKGALVAPMLAGLDNIRSLADRYGLALLAHPTFAGSLFQDPEHGIAPGLWLGTFMRLAGCDGTVFPNYGGRFTFSRSQCLAIADASRQDLPGIRPTIPAPAGGMSLGTIPQMAADYGPDTMFLIGGGLLSHSESLARSTELFRKRVEECFPDAGTNASSEHHSACELPRRAFKTNGFDTNRPAAVDGVLRFQTDFSWDGRDVAVYKANATLPFAGVDRIELVGRTGEATAFDVRYFEIAPGGYSSRERHRHTHVVIPVRGEGILETAGTQHVLKHLDVAYIAPLSVHQLRNDSSEPFGFFCIVDHDRDRPMAP